MWKLFKGFLKEEDGLGTVEIVIIIAVLVGLALIFRSFIFKFLNEILKRLFETGEKATSEPTSTDMGTGWKFD